MDFSGLSIGIFKVNISPEIKKELYFAMLRIRRVQERIESLYVQDEMRTPVHLCIGQEAVAVGVCHNLSENDYLSSNHRGHGHYLAKGGNLRAMIAELYCKTTGCSKGFGGSMHLIDTKVGHMGSSSIVGSGIPIGTGLGLSIKMKGTNQVSVIFLGDGASEEGVFYESINFAMLKKLPVLFVIEDNKWSVCSHVKNRQIGDNVFLKGVPDEHLLTAVVDGNDVLLVYETIEKTLKRARNHLGPSLIKCETYRILGHAGCAEQDLNNYRSSSEINYWKSKCPIMNLRSVLYDLDILNEEEEALIEHRIKIEIDESFDFAMKSPFPSQNNLDRYLFKT